MRGRGAGVAAETIGVVTTVHPLSRSLTWGGDIAPACFQGFNPLQHIIQYRYLG